MKNQLLISAFLLAILFLVDPNLQAQDRFTQMKQQLEILKQDVPALEENIEISVNEISLEEFLRGIAVTNKINLSVSADLTQQISNNFVDVAIADVLMYLAREYNLDMKFTGTIITISKHQEEVVEVIENKPSPVIYNNSQDKLSLDFNNQSLPEVMKIITQVSGKNVIAESGLEAQKVNGYIQDMPFDNAMEKFAMTNNLELSVSGDGFYILSQRNQVEQTDPRNPKKSNLKNGAVTAANFEYNAVDPNNISINAIETPIIDIFRTISNALGTNYYVLSPPTGNTSLNINSFTYDAFLDYLFKSTEFTHKKQNGIYIIGSRKVEDLRQTKVIELQHRSVEKIVEQIPEDIKTGVAIREFNELNSLILSGSAPNIAEIEVFLQQIDKAVPVVMIEVLIIDYNSSHNVSTGIQAGIGQEPAGESSGQLYPSVNYNMNSGTVNDLIESLNGFGWFKLGKVSPRFYMHISALEDQGVLRVRSTPKLATLNGNEASLSIGNTEYYSVESNNVIGTQNPQNIITRRYESVNADLKVTIKPFVSGDEQITLEVSVEQSDFTARASPESPPGSVTRSFKSLIRVKNGEMVLLGGLEQKSRENSGSGVPVLARIPVLKWFFSSRTNSRKSDKLNIFIKPTVFY